MRGRRKGFSPIQRMRATAMALLVAAWMPAWICPAHGLTVDSDDPQATLTYPSGETVDLNFKGEAGATVWILLEFPSIMPGATFVRPNDAYCQAHSAYLFLFPGEGGEEHYYLRPDPSGRIAFGAQSLAGLGEVVVSVMKGESPGGLEPVQVIRLVEDSGSPAAGAVPEGADWATRTLNDPWDMSNPEDAYELGWVHNLASMTLENGILGGVPRDNDPHVWVLFPGVISSDRTLDERTGDNGPGIDADRYHLLAYYMWLPPDVSPGTKESVGRVVWHFGGDTAEEFSGNTGEYALFHVYPGWHLYVFDLKALAPTSGKPWGGTVRGLRIDPILHDREFKLDWVRLVAPGDSASVLEVPRADAPLLFLDDNRDLGDGFLASLTPSSPGKFSLAALAPGTYRAAAGDAPERAVFLEQPVRVNAAPRAAFLSPNPLSGEDFATAVLGNPWEMDDPADVPRADNLREGEFVAEISPPGISGTFYRGVSTPMSPTGDPGVYVLLGTPFDADRYRYLGFTLYVPFDGDDQNELGLGSVARVAWKADDFDSGVTSDDLLLYPGLRAYVVDMKNLDWEPAAARTWGGILSYLRVDPFEFPQSREFYLDSVRLCAMPEFRGAMPLTLRLEDPDSPSLDVRVFLGEHEAGSFPAEPGERTFQVDLSSVPPGEHPLRVVVEDGTSSNEATMAAPVSVLP